jgi:hypothetical protein
MALDTKAIPELGAKLSSGTKIHLTKVHLFTLIEFHLDPFFQTIQAAQPKGEIIPTYQSRWLNYNTISSVMPVDSTSDPGVEACGINTNHGNEILKCPHQSTLLPVGFEYRENGLVDYEICATISKYSSRARLSPEVERDWETHLAKFSIEHLIG